MEKQSIHPLRRWLFNHHVTGRAFSKRLGITSTHLSNIMNWRTLPSMKLANEISVATQGAITANDFQNKGLFG